jgi:excisionase family DNA binding protein
MAPKSNFGDPKDWPHVDPKVWGDWQTKFIEEEIEAYRDQVPEESAEVIPEHELMTGDEVCTKLRWSLRTLYRNTKARKLPYVKRDGRLMFKRADVERYDKKRYVPEK